MNSSSLWLGGGVVLLALYLAAVRAGTVALDASAVVLIVVVGCFCVYTAASLGRLMKNKPEEKAAKKKKKAKKIDNGTEARKSADFPAFVFRLPRRAQSCKGRFYGFYKILLRRIRSLLRAKREPEKHPLLSRRGRHELGAARP